MTPSQKQKAKIKERIALSNEMVKKGLPSDPWVVEFRLKNNAIKANWKARQTKKPKTPIQYNKATWFKKGQVPHNKKSMSHNEVSKLRWRDGTKKWHKENRERINAKRREKRAKNPSFRIAANLRKRLSFLVKQAGAGKLGTMDLLGCSMEAFLIHLASNFKEGMSFSNYGEWHIDHIKPCAKFDLTKYSEQRECFHYTNLQPLWAQDNRAKSDKY